MTNVVKTLKESKQSGKSEYLKEKTETYIENNLNGCIYCKIKSLILLILPILCICVFIFARDGKPEFLRAIKGANFIGIWLKYSLVIFALEKIIINRFSKSIFERHTNDVIYSKYDTQSMLTVNHIIGTQYTAYILLKLK